MTLVLILIIICLGFTLGIRVGFLVLFSILLLDQWKSEIMPPEKKNIQINKNVKPEPDSLLVNGVKIYSRGYHE